MRCFCDVSHCAAPEIELVKEVGVVKLKAKHTVVAVEHSKVISKRAAPDAEEEDLGHQPTQDNIPHQEFDMYLLSQPRAVFANCQSG